MQEHDPLRYDRWLVEALADKVPKVMFLIFPVLTLMIWMLHWRRGHGAVEHVVFTLHFQTVVFIAVMANSLLVAPLPDLPTYVDWVPWLPWLASLLFLVLVLRGAYSQPFWLAAAKGLLFFAGYTVVFLWTIRIAVWLTMPVL